MCVASPKGLLAGAALRGVRETEGGVTKTGGAVEDRDYLAEEFSLDRAHAGNFLRLRELEGRGEVWRAGRATKQLRERASGGRLSASDARSAISLCVGASLDVLEVVPEDRLAQFEHF